MTLIIVEVVDWLTGATVETRIALGTWPLVDLTIFPLKARFAVTFVLIFG